MPGLMRKARFLYVGYGDDTELSANLFQVLNKDDGSWTPIFSGTLACKGSAGKNSWRDGHCALLDSHRKYPKLPFFFSLTESC